MNSDQGKRASGQATPTEDAAARKVEAARAEIAEQKLAEQAEARLAAIINSSNDAIIGKDLSSVVTSWNVGAERIFGYSAREMIGQSITRLIPPERLAEELQIIDRIKKGESVEHFETTRMAKDGRLIDVAVTVSPIKDKTGKIVGASKVARNIGERKQTEKALHRERDFISAVVDTVGSLVVVIDRQARIIRFNRYCEQLTGYSFAEVQGRNLIDLLIMPGERKTTTAEFLNLCAGQFPNTFENHWVTKQGNPRVIAWSNTALLDAEGKVEYVIGTGADITERKRAENLLQERNEQLRLYAEHSPAAIAMLDREMKYLVVSKRWMTGFRLGTDSIIGKSHYEIFPEIPQRWKDMHQRCLAGAVEKSDEEPFHRQDGSTDWVRWEIQPWRQADGVTGGIIIFTEDISERKRAEDALHESEKQFRTMVDAIPQLACMTQADGLVVWCNRRWNDYTGTTIETMAGTGWESVIDPDFLPEVVKAWKVSIATGEPFEMEFPIRAADGHYGWFLTRVFPFKDDAGKVIRWFGTNTDVSDKRAAGEKIQELNANLERRVAERTTELEAANRELEAFSYSVSHDLRAPLRAVDGFSQAVLEDYGAQLPEQGRRDLQTIRAGAQRMGILIDDLLTFSRLGRTPLKKQAVDITYLVGHVLEELNYQREGREVEIRIGDLPRSPGDPALLNQVWVNLISNALKYTRRRETAVIEIGCKLEHDEQVYFVRDNGAGFDMRYANKLFGVFQRLHRADEFEGTGVGLAIVQRIIHRHGGQIWAKAAPNLGATFYFTLGKGTSV